MPSDGGGTTTGIWFGADERELLEEFDRLFPTQRGSDFSRSRELKRAMRVYMTVERVLRDEGVADEVAPREREGVVRQALLDLYRE
jgi:hypothetical protein